MKPLILNAGELMHTKPPKHPKRDRQQAIGRIEALRRASAEAQRRLEQLHESIELVQLEVRKVEGAIAGSSAAQRPALLMSLGEHVLRSSALRQEFQALQQRVQNETPNARAEMVQLEAELTEAAIEEASALLSNARESTRKAVELLQIGASVR